MIITFCNGKTLLTRFSSGTWAGYRAKSIEFGKRDFLEMAALVERDPRQAIAALTQLAHRFEEKKR